jgi:hypothetical protein
MGMGLVTAARDVDRLDALRPTLRDPGVVCAPERLGAARMTRHSFAPSFLRFAASRRVQVDRERWTLDGEGHGEAIYRVQIDAHTLRFVLFSTTIPATERIDRVIAASWDVTAALIEGELDEDRLTALRREVPLQERGRADAGTLVWTRANRSERFFDEVVERLAGGRQPSYEMIGPCAYVLRSTAFYGNGKFGMKPFAALRPPHPMAVPYRAQMLAAWLLREFSLELVEHCARERSEAAVPLSPAWGRYLGIGNATGLGMVPFFANHPAIFDAWCSVREFALANARATRLAPDDAQVARLLNRCDRVITYLDDRRDLPTAPFPPYGETADELRLIRAEVAAYAETGRLRGVATHTPWETLWRWAEHEVGVEGQELLLGLLTELDDSLDEALEQLLTVDETDDCVPDTSLRELTQLIERHYGWVERFAADPATATWVWYYAAENEEPRRARRAERPLPTHEVAIDVARQVQRLRADLRSWPPDCTVAAFLLEHPRHRGIVERLQTFGHLPYAEVHDDLVGEDFLPLQIQRFKLAMYGMANYVPQSTDWVRVTLYQGAPRTSDLFDVDLNTWTYPRRPDEGEPA